MSSRSRQRGAWRWPSRWAWAQAIVALLVTAAVAMLWLSHLQAGPLARLDGLVQDAQAQWRGRLAPGATYPVTLVRFDDASAARFGGMAPGRPLLADAITKLQAARPRLIAVDMLLLDAKPESDAALAAAMRGGAPVLLPFAMPPGTGGGIGGVAAAGAASAPSGIVPPGLLPQAFMRAEGTPRSALLPERADAPPEPLLSAAKALGHVQAEREIDGTLRHDLPALPLDGEVYPSLAVRIAGDAMRQPWSEATLRWSRDLRWGSLRVPLDLLSRQGVNYYGPAGTFPSVTLADLVDGKVPEEALRNRIVIIGVSALGAGDHFPSPFDAGLPGMERLATVVDNILTGRTLTRPSWAPLAELAALLVLPLLCALLLARGSLWRGLPVVVLLVGGGLYGAQWAFEEEHLVLALAYPLLAVAAASLAALTLRALADQSRRREALRRLTVSEERYALAALGANDGLWDWDIASDRLDVSARWLALMGDARAPGEEPGGTKRRFWHRPKRAASEDVTRGSIERFTRPLDEPAAGLFRADLDAHLQGRSFQFHHVLHFEQGGQTRALLARGVAVRQDGKPVRMAGSLTDISENERLQAQVAHEALHDRLTGLPNRALFVELLAQRLANPTPGVPIGVALVGLDDFRAFNERHGLIAGDAVLIESARRLAGGAGRAARAGRVVARLGADQFGVLFEARIEAGALVDRVPEWALARIEEPFLFDTLEAVQGSVAAVPMESISPTTAPASAAPATPTAPAARTGAHRLTACAGWAFTGQGNFSPDDLMAAAESALARAKAAGAGHARLFDPAQQLVEQSRRWVKENIARGLEAGEFQLHYQPFVRLSDRALLGFEALIRWKHPTRGMVMPGDFIPVAEESGQIVEIGRWTLIEAALQLRRWREIGFKGEIAVNVSGVQLERDAELLNDARETLKALGDVPASQLKLEVTESMAMANPQRSAEVLQELARMGFKLSIDDFGTGYSSLAYLHRFPFDTLKIDRSFVMRLGAGRESREIVRTIVGLADALGKQTLAEGVEEEAQAALLEELGVQVAQGWLFAKALPAEEAKRLIQTVPWKKPG
ncbi:EAL domain-containing protein [Mitsuaria sp. 7]|uniref:EAL domain-containing protein n=1 Tax=Mitsuaria sp. 7 TaxID=1658665 RepID=UPI0018D34CDD|nr:EAL domain-containing protein [Mitsuaria sp. 7]